MTSGYVLLAVLSGAACQLSTAHQHWWPAARRHAARWRLVGLLAGIASLLVGARALGWWPGTFAALTAWMLAAVLLPWLDAWQHSRRDHRHVE